MDSELTVARASRTSRRAAVRLLAGGTVALAAARTADVEAAPAFAPGWTHIAGTYDGLLFYRASSGKGISGKFDDGRFTLAQRYSGFTTGWTLIAGGQSGILFYQPTGYAGAGYLDYDGVYHFVSNYELEPGWTLIGLTPNTGYTLIYNKATGQAVYGSVQNSGWVEGGSQTLAKGWTHIGCAADSVLLYNKETGKAISGHLNDSVGFTRKASYDLGTGWTHFAGRDYHNLLVYNARTGEGLSALLDDEGRYHRVGKLDFGKGWTHLVGAGGEEFLFYDKATGKAIGGYLTPEGAWKLTRRYG